MNATSGALARVAVSGSFTGVWSIGSSVYFSTILDDAVYRYSLYPNGTQESLVRLLNHNINSVAVDSDGSILYASLLHSLT